MTLPCDYNDRTRFRVAGGAWFVNTGLSWYVLQLGLPFRSLVIPHHTKYQHGAYAMRQSTSGAWTWHLVFGGL
jgi:hypothetical protein